MSDSPSAHDRLLADHASYSTHPRDDVDPTDALELAVDDQEQHGLPPLAPLAQHNVEVDHEGYPLHPQHDPSQQQQQEQQRHELLDAHLELSEDHQQPDEGSVLDPDLTNLQDQSVQGQEGGHLLQDVHLDASGSQTAEGGAVSVGGKGRGRKRTAASKDGTDAGEKQVKASLSTGDWMRVFQFMDQGSGISQLKTVQHFASLQHDPLFFNQATLSRTLKKRDVITTLHNSSAHGPNLKRARKVKFPEIEAALLGWIDERRNEGQMPGGKEIKLKVVALQEERGMDPEQGGLKGTNGWLESFLATHDISLPPTASSEAKRLKKANGDDSPSTSKRTRQRKSAANRSNGAQSTFHPSGAHDPSLSQGLDSNAAHLGIDSYLESDMGGPSSYAMHGHEGPMGVDDSQGGMNDLVGQYVLSLNGEGTHDLGQVDVRGPAHEEDHQQQQQPQDAEGADAVGGGRGGGQESQDIDPSLHDPDRPRASSYLADGFGAPNAAGSTTSSRLETMLSQLDHLENLLETDQAAGGAGTYGQEGENGEDEVEGGSHKVGGWIKALGEMKAYLALHHQAE